MATVYYLGKSSTVAQVSTAQVTAYDAATTYKLTVGGVTVSAVGNTSVTQTASDLADAWNASTHVYLTGVTAANNASDTVTLTADTAGVPFVVTSSVTGGTGTIGAVSTSTASAGPNDWSTAANWSGGSVPVNSDVVVISNASTPILWGLDQSAVTLAELRILYSYTGKIGLPKSVFTTSSAGDSTNSTVDEYRDDYLRIGATLVNVGVPAGNDFDTGPTRVKVNTGSVQTTATVFNTASSGADASLEAVRIKGTHASNKLNVSNGIVGTATENAGEVSTWSEINIGRGSGGFGATVNIGAGCTLTTVNVGGGVVTNRGSNVTTLTVSGGSYRALGSSTHTTVNVRDGSVLYDSDGTITNLNIVGSFDTSSDPRPKTITNASLYSGCSFLADTGVPASVTVTNGLDLVECGVEDVTVNLGNHYTLTQSSI